VEVVEQLPLEASAAQRARALVEPFRELLSDGAFDVLRLLASELVGNCVRHGGRRGGITVDVKWEGDHVRLAVGCASGPGRPRIVTAGYRGGGGGLGLRLVDRLARQWGVTEAGGQTWVWAEVGVG
jgi:anti-sigma regulatory factor (Ser/Thr protein kinase)